MKTPGKPPTVSYAGTAFRAHIIDTRVPQLITPIDNNIRMDVLNMPSIYTPSIENREIYLPGVVNTTGTVAQFNIETPDNK